MSQPKNILVFGGTGYIGSYILTSIIEAKSSFGRIAIFTSSDTLSKKGEVIEKLKAQGVEIITGDIAKESDIVKAYEGIDTVISAVGRNVIADQTNLIKLASTSSSVKRFYPSEFGTDIEYNASSANEKPHQQKLKVRAFAKTITNLEFTFVVTGPFPDAQGLGYLASVPKALEKVGSFDVIGKRAVLIGGGATKISLTTNSDVGKLVVRALLHSDDTKYRILRVNSFTTTPLEIVAEFEKQTGGQKWEVGFVPLEELKQLEKEAWDGNNPIATLFTLRRIWGEGGTLYEERDNGKIEANDTETLEQTVKKAVEVQTFNNANLHKNRKV